MIKSEAEKIAKKHKKLFETFTVINHCFNYRSQNWWLAEYKKFPGVKRSGYVVISSIDSSYDEKVFVLEQYLAFIGGVIRVQSNIRPRVNAIDSVRDTLGQMNRLLEEWAESEEDKGKLADFKTFSEFILWCADMEKEFYETFLEIVKRVDKARSFTKEDNVQLLELLPKMDLIMYLDVKRKYEQLEANKQLLNDIKQTKSRLKTKDYAFITESLFKLCGPEAEKDNQSIFNETTEIWRKYPATKETFYELLDSAKERHMYYEEKELEERRKLIRN